MTDETPREADAKKKARVFTEEAKQQQVSHWDLDYLPADEVDAIARRGDGGDADAGDRP